MGTYATKSKHYNEYPCPEHYWTCCPGSYWYTGVMTWRHDIETFSASLALCKGNPPVTGGFPSQRSQQYGAFVLCLPEEIVEETVELPVIWLAMAPMWCQVVTDRHKTMKIHSKIGVKLTPLWMPSDMNNTSLHRHLTPLFTHQCQ